MNWKLSIRNYLVIGILVIGICLPAFAMGTAPKKEEPKYKLEILKMELVPTMTASLEIRSDRSAVLILPSKNFKDTELSQIKEKLEAKGVKVSLASDKKSAVSLKGKSFKMDLLTKDVEASNYHAMIFIGDDRAVVGGKIVTRSKTENYQDFTKAILKALGL